MKFVSFIFMIFVFMSCADKSKPLPVDPIPAHETIKMESKEVGETRTINVWTPPEYTIGTDSFPVLYMPDGGIEEDFPHVANTLADLVKAKKIKPIILVGIENTQRRKDMTPETEVEEDKKIAPVVGGADAFMAFIQNEMMVEINKKYRTTNEKGIIGESLAGLFVTEIFLQHPEMFDFYIAFDPSLWWNNQKLLKSAGDQLSKFPESQKRYWFAGSDAEDISNATNELARVLDSAAVKSLTWQYSDEPKEQHNTIFRAAKEKALIWILNAK